MEPVYIEGRAGQLFANYFAPEAAAARASRPSPGALIFVPPFAEELNRSRHMMAAAARQLAAAGVGCLLLDLYGTGDSGGEFADGDWATWCADLATARAWLEERGIPSLGFIALRSGALLAADALAEAPAPLFIVWSPVLNGEQFLTQFLRLRVAESMGREGAPKETTKDLKAALDRGETLEIGGYALTPAVAEALSARRFADHQPPAETTVHWFELGPALTPGAEKLTEAWIEAGVKFTATALAGPAFWTLLEPEFAPPLLAATVAAVRELAS